MSPEMKEEMGVCSRVVFGMEPNQMSFLYFIMYAAAAGGVLCLLESTPGSAQEFRVKVTWDGLYRYRCLSLWLHMG